MFRYFKRRLLDSLFGSRIRLGLLEEARQQGLRPAAAKPRTRSLRV